MNRDDSGKESIPLPRAHHSGDPTLDGLPGVFTAVLGIHPCQVPGSREEICLGAMGSVVSCRERAVMLSDVVRSQQGRVTSLPTPLTQVMGFLPSLHDLGKVLWGHTLAGVQASGQVSQAGDQLVQG